MHPLTVYEIAVREHERSTAQRLRTHQQALARRSVTSAPVADVTPRRWTLHVPLRGATARSTAS